MERDRVMKRRTAGDKTECESQGGEGGEDRRGYTPTRHAPIHRRRVGANRSVRALEKPHFTPFKNISAELKD